VTENLDASYKNNKSKRNLYQRGETGSRARPTSQLERKENNNGVRGGRKSWEVPSQCAGLEKNHRALSEKIGRCGSIHDLDQGGGVPSSEPHGKAPPCPLSIREPRKRKGEKIADRKKKKTGEEREKLHLVNA